MPDPQITVVMPARNEGGRVADTLRSFAHGRSFPFPLECIVVDDASQDGSCDSLTDVLTWQRDRAWVHVVRLPLWSGIPFARNQGAKAANAPILFITDANVKAEAGWDIPVWRDFRPNRALCATIADTASHWRGYGCRLDLPTMGIHWLHDARELGGYVPVSPCTGTVMATDLFHRIGGYDTAMPVYGAAEPEFSVRLWLAGSEIIASPDMVLTHRFRPPSERRPFLARIASLQAQNYLRFGLLYLDEPGTVRLLHYWANATPEYFDDALRRVEAGDVWDRRRHLQQQLPHDFSWFIERFGLRYSEERS